MDTDIQINNINDISIINGDFVINPNAEQQEANLIINTSTGNWFQFPLVGVGITNYLASSITALTLQNIIKNQLIADGFVVQKVSVVGSTIQTINITVLATRPNL